jgi:ABC-type Na+ efflux pump permease subunit
MSNATIPIGENQVLDERDYESSGSTFNAWWLMFIRELADLWIGGKALYLILAYSVFLGFQAYSQVKTSESSLIPSKEMVFATLQIVFYTGGLIGLIIGADSISGERERGTLEALLLTPISRRQIVLGKFLAGLSPWPIALIIAIPFLRMLAQGDPVFGQSLLLAGFLGSLLVLGFTSLGMLVSFWTNSNKVSFFVSLGIYLLIMLPTSWPGTSAQGYIGKLFQRMNPLEGTNVILEKIMVNNRSLAQYEIWMRTPEVFAVVTVGILLLYAGSRLRIDANQR